MNASRTRRSRLPWRRRVLVLGDSHAHVFGHWRFRLRMPGTRFDRCIVGGATASGLANPNSKTGAQQRFAAALDAGGYDHLVTLLGEVDTGFVLWYRAKKYGQSIEAMLDLAIANYARLLERCVASAPTVVVSAPLPTIGDDHAWGEVANLRREVTASRAERTRLTLDFNAELGALASRVGAAFVSLDTASLDDRGTVAEKLLNPNPLDHHYAPGPYAAMLAPRLASALSVGAPASRAPAPTRAEGVTA